MRWNKNYFKCAAIRTWICSTLFSIEFKKKKKTHEKVLQHNLRYGKTRQKRITIRRRGGGGTNPTYAERTTFNWMLVFYATHTPTHISFQICLHHSLSHTPFNSSFFFFFFWFTPENFLYRKYKWFKPTGQKLKPSEINWQIISHKPFRFSPSLSRSPFLSSDSLFPLLHLCR